MKVAIRLGLPLLLLATALTACATPANLTVQSEQDGPRVLAAETFLADIAQNVAGERLKVDALIPIDVDPHSFEPTPADVRMVADSDLLIVNGAGFEAFLAPLLKSAGGQHTVVEAAAGLTGRKPQPGEHALDEPDGAHAEGDPHFWLDPNNVVKYVENIRDGLTQADPGGKDTYAKNAEAYIAKLQDLDAWIVQQVASIPEGRRLLVTNHESFGYFADRYGFRVVGALIPSVSTAASPSAKELAHLADEVRATGARAVFLEAGSNTQLAEQLSGETGIKLVGGLLTHSVTSPVGVAPDYISMMRHNVQAIVQALR